MMFIIYGITVIKTQKDFDFIKQHPQGNYAIGENINIVIDNEDLLPIFSGFISGGRSTITISRIRKDFQFIRNFHGTLQDCNIVITSDIYSSSNFSVIENVVGGKLSNMGFSLQMVKLQEGINISFFGSIQGSFMNQCFFYQQYTSQQTNNNIYGISMTLVGSQCIEINVNQSITKISNITGAFQLLNSIVQINITQYINYANVIYGLAFDIQQHQNNVRIFCKTINSNSVFGISYILQKDLINSDIKIYCDLNVQTHKLIGIAQSIQGNLKNINLALNFIVTKPDSVLNLMVTGISNNLAKNIQIENIALLFLSYDVNTSSQIALISDSPILVQYIKNLALYFKLVTSHNMGLQLSLCDTQISSQLSQFYISGEVNAQSETNKMNITLLSNQILSSIIANFSVNCDIIAAETSDEHLDYQLSEQITGSNITSLSSILNINSKINKGEISGFATFLTACAIQKSVLFLKIEISGQNIFALSTSIKGSNFKHIGIFGEIAAENQLYGISQNFINSVIENLIHNLRFMGGKTCYTIAYELEKSSFSNFVEQAALALCGTDAKIFETQKTSTFNPGCGFLKAVGKANNFMGILLTDMKTGDFVDQLVSTVKWEVDSNYNNELIMLTDMFSVNSLQQIEVRKSIIEPFRQIGNGRIYLNNPQNLCIGDCHGVFDGNELVCAFGYTGDQCQLLDCTGNVCGINGYCLPEGCQCGPGQKGELCQKNYCTECLNGANGCFNVQYLLPYCSGGLISDCYHGTITGSFCICDDGYSTINSPCDQFYCRNDQDCNNNQCINGQCSCESPKAGLSCKFQTDPGSANFKARCVQGSCEHGIGCIYLDGNDGPWECSLCNNGQILPTCELCDDDHISVNDECLKECQQCLSGKCYYLESCVSMNPEECQFSCLTCQPGITGDKCDKCLAGSTIQLFYDWECRTILTPDKTFGFCFEYKKDYICTSCLPDYILYKQKCVLECRPSNCINGDCLPNQVCRCDTYFTGNQCDTCVSGTQFLDGKCVQECQTCNGQCFYNANNIVFCQSCDIGYEGQQCLDCVVGYLDIEGSCFQVCGTCGGLNCYIDDKGVKICPLGCFDGYIGQSCETCDTGYDQLLGRCQLKCQTCIQGDCYQIDQTSIYCTKCNFNLVGTQCDFCLDGFVMDNFQCHEQVTNDQCFMKKDQLFCLSCEGGKILISNLCYQQCDLLECAGNCYFSDSSFVCISCYSGYIMKDSKCLKQDLNQNGLCYEKGQRIICECYPGFVGETCEECEDFKIDGKCYLQLEPSNGDCYKDVTDATKITCKSCSPQYSLPLCSECNSGYQLDSGGTCLDCQPGYVSSNTLPTDQVSIIGDDRCVLRCQECAQGDCFYVGGGIVCTQCKEGFNFVSNCNSCQPGYTMVGSYCFQSNTGESSFGDSINFQCDDLRQSFNCSLCTIGDSDAQQCKQHSLIHPGQCFIMNKSTVCKNESCLQFNLDSENCLVCDSKYLLMNQSCWQSLQQEENIFKGICYMSDEKLYCQKCQLGWSGNTCSECQSNYVKCPCQTGVFSQCCCPVIQQNGVCYQQQFGGVVCQQCKKGFELENNQCIEQQKSYLFLLYWILPMVIVLMVLLGVAIWLACMDSQKRFRLRIRYRKAVLKIGVRILFVVLAQILSVIIALQDQFINDLYMQVTVNIFSMIPFIIYFAMFMRPDKSLFFYNKSHHYLLFGMASFLELCYNMVQFNAVPDILQDFGQQMYKLAGPSVTLLLCIFFAGYIFTKKQKIALYCGLIIPITFQFTLAIIDSLKNGFFTGMDGFDIILGQAMIGIAIVINGLYFYSLSIILGKYGEMGSIGRFAVSSITLNSVVGLVYPQQVILSVFQTDIFTFSLISQVFFNIINIIVMSRLTAVEFSINLISSAIWVQLISEVGSLNSSKENYYSSSPFILVLEIISLVVLFTCIVFFYMSESAWYNNKNQRRDKTENTSLLADNILAMMQNEKDIIEENILEWENFSSAQRRKYIPHRENQTTRGSYKVNINSEHGQQLLRTHSSKKMPEKVNQQQRIYEAYWTRDINMIQQRFSKHQKTQE